MVYDFSGGGGVLNDAYGQWNTERIKAEEEQARLEKERRDKKQFNIGNLVQGGLMSLLTMNPTPLLLAAGGEAARSATSSDMDLANMALNLGSKYLPTGPGAGPKTDINTGGLYKGTPTTPPLSQYGMGSVGLKNYVPNVQAPIANVTQPNFFEQLKGAMTMPEDWQTKQKREGFEKAKSIGDWMVESATDPITGINYKQQKKVGGVPMKPEEVAGKKLVMMNSYDSSGNPSYEWKYIDLPNPNAGKPTRFIPSDAVVNLVSDLSQMDTSKQKEYMNKLMLLPPNKLSAEEKAYINDRIYYKGRI